MCKGGLNVREFVKGGWAPVQLSRNVFVPMDSFLSWGWGWGGGWFEVMGQT